MAKWLQAAIVAGLALASYGAAASAEDAAAIAFGAKARTVLPAKALIAGEASLKPQARATTRGAKETNVYKAASPAVVMIFTDEAYGSGALISADGKIVTNLHVVGEEDFVGVVFKPAQEGAAIDKTDMRFAKVIRRDAVADLAVIQVREVPAGVTPLPIAQGDTIEVGADVHAIGHPTGEAWTYTRGIVSQVRRGYHWTPEGGLTHQATVIQTQTPINPGNSGGPLLNDQLELVGINSFIGDGEGIGFAVSAEDVRAMLARTEDRAGRPAPKAKEVEAAACEPKVVAKGRMTSGRGDVFDLDLDCDGKRDAVVVDPDNKREPITTLVDTDGSGKPDAVYFDSDRDGKDDYVEYDTDEDGKMDVRGLYRKGEEEPYRLEKIDRR